MDDANDGEHLETSIEETEIHSVEVQVNNAAFLVLIVSVAMTITNNFSDDVHVNVTVSRPVRDF